MFDTYNYENNTQLFDTTVYSKGHVAGRVDSVDQHMAEVKAFIANGNSEAETMDATIRGHVWLDSAFAVPAVRNKLEHIKRSTDVLARLEKAKQGFLQLPVEKDLDLNAAPDSTGRKKRGN